MEEKLLSRGAWILPTIDSDSMKLEELADETFDLVYTSNGVHVWIHDLGTMYRNFHRILKENGRYIMFDTHPWSRPFDKKLLGKRRVQD